MTVSNFHVFRIVCLITAGIASILLVTYSSWHKPRLTVEALDSVLQRNRMYVNIKAALSYRRILVTA